MGPIIFRPVSQKLLFSEEVLSLKDLEHTLNRMWCKFRKNWNGSFRDMGRFLVGPMY